MLRVGISPSMRATTQHARRILSISRRLGARVILENDANAAALGEKWMGAGRDEARLYLQDQLWESTRGEQRRIQRWIVRERLRRGGD